MDNGNKPVVAVLMSTYNGENYIAEQIKSIISQRDVQIRLFVRDDGSTDQTLGIIRSLMGTADLTVIEDGENLGPGSSFMKLLYTYANDPDIDYFAFADQDDIWLEKKLITAAQSIEKSGYAGPVLYCSNQTLYCNEEVCGERYSEPQNIELIYHLTINTISGCTFVLNKDLAQLINSYPHCDSHIVEYRMHDSWIILIAIICGHVIYDQNSNMLYRIHDHNTVGIKGISFKERVSRFKRLFIKNSYSNIRMREAKALLCFPISNDRNRENIEMIANYRRSFKDKLALIRNREIVKGCGENPVMFVSKVIFNFL